MKNFLNRLTLSVCVALWASALSAQTHFEFDYRQYQNDMTIYFMLFDGDTKVSNLDNYEVAAFVGDECRGVGEFKTETGTNDQTVTYGYLRVYSNASSGETVTFKAYNKTTEKEVGITTASAVSFSYQGLLGMPSTPVAFTLQGGEEPVLVPGDADGDNEVTVNDIIMAIQVSLGNELPGFSMTAADIDGDGEITVNDIIIMIQISL